MSLLSKTRELNTLLQKHKGIAVDFKDVAQTISSVTVTNVFIVYIHLEYVFLPTFE
jgi:transcriptional pleiotropic repressor